jgi:hypothetical protein
LIYLLPKTLNKLTFQPFNFERTWWRILQKRVVPDEEYYRNASYLMENITETRRTWWRILQKRVVPDEGYYRNASYLMKDITETRRTWWRILQKRVVPDGEYYRNASYLMENITETHHAHYIRYQRFYLKMMITWNNIHCTWMYAVRQLYCG